MKNIYKQERVGSVQQDGVPYDVYAVIRAEYHQDASKLRVYADAFLRRADSSGVSEQESRDWLPHQDVVEYTLDQDEVHDAVEEVFQFWIQKVAEISKKKLFSVLI